MMPLIRPLEPPLTFKERIISVWRWLRKNVLNKDMFLSVAIAEIIFWSPCIVTASLAIFSDARWWSAFSSIIIFWSGPLTPAMPLQFALAGAIKKLIGVIKKYDRQRNGERNI